MGPLTRSGEGALLFALLISCATVAHAQLPASNRCTVFSVPVQVHAEGLSEGIGDIVFQCNGAPGFNLTGNYTFYLPVNITNRIDSQGVTTGAALFIDYGLGFAQAPVSARVYGNNNITFSGVSVTVPASGSFALKLSGVRANMRPLKSVALQNLSVSFSVPLSVDRTSVVVASSAASLFSTQAEGGIPCTGSSLPGTITLAELFAAKTTFASTRLTEGFGTAFVPRGPGEDAGTRFLIKYTGFPANAHVYVPDLIAGSNALQPTAGGDLGYEQSGGEYVPGSATLLLARVDGAQSDGSGGTPIALPTGSNPAILDTASEIPLTDGAGFVVYEVMSSNAATIENAQFPTFVGIAGNTQVVAEETVTLAPLSGVDSASTDAPVPRFVAIPPANDCALVGDCQADYFPKLSVPPTPVNLTGIAGAAGTGSQDSIYVRNVGGGIMNWTASINYANGSDWLFVSPTSGRNNQSIQLTALPQHLAEGTYRATVVLDAGQYAGSATVPVTLAVSAPPPGPLVTSVLNAATFQFTPLVAGSVTTVMGVGFAANDLSVTFDGVASNILFSNNTQINLEVPAVLASVPAATMVVKAGGLNSTPKTLSLAPAWPAIFQHGVLNQDNHENTAATPAAAGSFLQIFGIGMPPGAEVTATIAGRAGLKPVYAGPAPTVPGVQQVNVAVPADLAPQTTQLVLCAKAEGQSYCSPPYPLTVN